MDREFIKIERTQAGWQMLFQKLYQIARANAGSQLIAKKPMNVIRNRYRDVLPIDSTRVVLDDPDSDYINANFVKVEEVGRSYILCQGPLQHTTPHFWQMVWEQKTVGVIMLNKCVERGMNKCFPYWPQPNDPPMDLGKFVVENIGYDDGVSYRLSRLKLMKVDTESSREIQHFHYTRWPDFGVPQNPEVFLDFLYAVRAAGVLESDKGPAVVHCSAGIGRSGTFCIVDTLLAKLEQTRDISSVDLQGTLLDMRRHRLGLIQTADQLRFSYIAILQGALQDMELEPSNYDDLVDEDEEKDDEEEEEEVETEDSDEEEEDEDTEERQKRKYPNLTRRASSPNIPVVDADDVPPPLPPRPIETLRPQSYEGSESSEEEDVVGDESPLPSPPTTPPPPSSTPPPPTSPPPPSITEPVTSDSPAKKIKLDSQDPSFFDPDSDDEEYGFVVSSYSGEKVATTVVENGELEESGSKEDPPPIPPRNHSLSPGPSIYHRDYLKDDTGMADIYNTDPSSLWAREYSGDGHPFLSEGRGGERAYPPLPRMTNGISSNADDDDEPPPPIPTKLGRRKSGTRLEEITEEEKALVGELDILEKLMESTQKKWSDENLVTNSEVMKSKKLEEESPKEIERRRSREERRGRLEDKVQVMKDTMRNNEEGFESDWSIPWLLVGFVVMLGYCAYYIIQ